MPWMQDGEVDAALVQYLQLGEIGYEVAQYNAAFILDRSESSLFPTGASARSALHNWRRSAYQVRWARTEETWAEGSYHQCKKQL